jgi:pimeloyl-ACP methyl ester carboxylesterase
MRWTLVLLVLALMPLSVRAQQRTPIVAQEYQVPSASAKDGSPVMLAVSEKYQGGRDPNVQAASGRIVLLTHGSSFSGQVGVDVQVPGVPPEESYSLMDQLALRGYDVWTLAYQNYGRSDHHDCGLCVTTEAAARDIEATIQFIRGLRQVDQLHLIAWSWGAQAGGLVAQRHPDWVNRLVLNAPLLDLQEGEPPAEQFRTNNEAGLTRVFHPTTQVPEVVQAFLQAALQWDLQPPNGVLVDWRTDPMKMNPRQLTMPTLVIYGADDVITPLAGPNVYPFFRDLAAADKKFVVVPNAGHSLFMEQLRERWYQEVLLHLESGNSPLTDGGR